MAYENFIGLIKQGFYNGLLFHRIVTGYIQTGDQNNNGTGGTSIYNGKGFKIELNQNNHLIKPYQICMTNKGINTNNS